VRRTNDALFDSSGRPRPHTIRFETVPSDDQGEGGLRATKTVLTVSRIDGEQWELAHQQFRAVGELTWALGTCGRTELTMYVGTEPGDERKLEPLVKDGPMGLIEFLRAANERNGNEYSWELPGGFRASYRVTVPAGLEGLVDGGGSMRIPSTIRR